MSPRTSNLIRVMPAKEARSGQGAACPLDHRPGVGGRTGGRDGADPSALPDARVSGLHDLREAAVGAGADAFLDRRAHATSGQSSRAAQAPS